MPRDATHRSPNTDYASRVPIGCPNSRELAVKAGKSKDDPRTENVLVCRGIAARAGTTRSACHAEGRGFESLQPLSKRRVFAGLFRSSSRVVRLRHRTMTGQSGPRRLADAVGRCSLAGDSERPAPWNVCVPAEDRDRPRRVGARAPPAPLALSVVAMLPSSRSSTLNLRSCSSSTAGANSVPAETLAKAATETGTLSGQLSGAGQSSGVSAGPPVRKRLPTWV